MENNRKSFVFYKDWYDVIQKLDDKDAFELCKAIMSVAFGEEPQEMSTVSSAMMMLIRPQIERDISKWMEVRNKRQESGKLGGIAKQANATKCYQMLPNESTCKQTVANGSKTKQDIANLPVNVNVLDVNVNNNVNVDVDSNDVICKEKEDKSSKKRNVFVKPNVEEIRQYIEAQGYHVDAERFYNYYESKGWVVGKSPMKDWKAAVRTWDGNAQEQKPKANAAASSVDIDVVGDDGKVHCPADVDVFEIKYRSRTNDLWYQLANGNLIHHGEVYK